MANITWTAPGSGDWDTAIDWSSSPALPGSADAVTISTTGGATITHSVNAADLIASLTVGSTDTLSISSGSLLVSGTATINGALALSSGTFTLDGPSTIATLTQTGGTLAGTGEVTVAGSASLGATGSGTLIETGSGTTDLQAGGTLGGASSNPGFYLDGGRVLENDASFDWANGAIYMGYNPFGGTIGGSTIDNTGGATFDDAVAGIIYDGSGTNAFTNAGTFETTFASGTTTITVAFDNSGTVEIGSGDTLDLVGGSTDTGSFSGAGTIEFGGGTVTLSSGSSITSTAAFSGGTTTINGAYTVSGTTTVDGGTVNFDGSNPSLNTLILTSGTANFSSNNATVGTFTQTGGVLAGTGSGTTDLQAGGTLGSASSSPILSLDGGRVLENDGTFDWVNGTIYMGFNPFGSSIGGSTIDNTGGATFDDAVAGNIYNETGTNAFTNAGTFETSFASGTTTIAAAFDNSGTVEVGSGDTLDLTGGGTDSGSFTGAGAIGFGGPTTLTSASSITSAILAFVGSTKSPIGVAGAVDVTGGTVFSGATTTFSSTIASLGSTITVNGGTANIDGALTNNSLSSLTVSSGEVNFANNVSVGTLTQTGGELAGTGEVTVTGSALLGATGSGYLGETGSGTTDLQAGGTLGSADLTLDGGRVLENDASFDWANGAIDMGYNPFGGTIGGATFDNTGSAVFDDAVAGEIDYVSGTNEFTNAGTFETTFASGTTMILVAFNNFGTVEVGSGDTLTLSGTTTNSGTFHLTAGSTLAVTGTFSNFSGTQLTRGSYAIFGTSASAGTFEFVNANIVTNAATIVLDGVNSTILNSSNSANALANFATNAAAGIFTIQDGQNFTTADAFSNAGVVAIGANSTFTASGTLTNSGASAVLKLQGGTFTATSLSNSGSVFGFGTVTDAFANAGTIEANDGVLDLANGATGSGGATIDAGATLELGGALGETATFVGVATLKLDAPGNFTGSLTGLTGGDTLDFGSAVVTSATIGASAFDITVVGTTYDYDYTGTLPAYSALKIENNSHDVVLIQQGPPVVANAGNTVGYTQGGGASTVDASLSVTDPSSTTLVSATASISASQPGDTLTANTGGTSITASYSASTGVLTLSGTDTLADYQAVLDSVAYSSTSLNPTDYGTDDSRTVTWVVNDGINSSSPVSSTVDITAVDQPPVLSGAGNTVNYTQGGTAAAIDPGLTVSDPDNLTLQGGQLAISGGLFAGDALNFSTQFGITGSYNSGGGVLALSGSATLAQYQTALESITFSSSSLNPTDYGNDDSRTISWTVTDGTLDSSPATSTVDITAVDQPPVLSGAGNTVNYTQGETAVAIDAGLAVSDPDNLDLAGATVTISGVLLAGDTLNFTNQNGISGSYNSGSGVLTLSGSATLAQYQTALESITFSSSSLNPTDYGNDDSRTISWTVTDGTLDSVPVTSTVDIIGADQPPVLSGAGNTTTYAAGGSGVAIDAGLAVSDPENLDLAGATVTISAGFLAGDQLNFTNQNGISGSYNASSGILTLSGSATLAQYQAALESIAFNSSSLNPTDYGNDDSRTISWTVTDGVLSSSPVTSTVDVIGVYQPPVLSGAGNTTTYDAGGSGVAIDPGLTVSDPEKLDLAGATVTISGGLLAGDTLDFTNQNGISGSYNASSGVLTLSGSATLAQYQAALDSVTYSAFSPNPADSGTDPSRTISWQVNDGTKNSNVVTSTVDVIGGPNLPVITAPPSVMATLSGNFRITGVSLSETGNTAGETFTVTVTTTNGEIFASGSGVSPSGFTPTQLLIISGSLTQVNFDLGSLGMELSIPSGFYEPGAPTIISVNASDSFGATASPDWGSFELDWSSLEASSKASFRPPSVDSVDWDLIWDRFIDQVGTTTSSLVTALSQAAATLTQIGQSTSDASTLLSYELEQASGILPNITLADTTDLAPAGTGLDLSLTRTYSASLLNRNDPGVFGDGWTFTYGVSAVTDASGNVYITSPSGTEIFTLEPDGAYTAQAGDTSILTISDGAYVLNGANGTVTQFLPDGQLSSITDANGNTVDVSYDSNGVISGVTGSNGQSLTFTTNSQGRITSATDGEGQQTTYAYDASGDHLISVSGPDGVTSYSYDSSGNPLTQNALTQITNPNGTTENFQYNSTGSLSLQSGSNGTGEVTYAYPSPGTVTETDAAANATTSVYGANGNLAELTDALGNVTQYQYNSSGELTGLVTPTGGTYAYSYDSNGNVTSYTDPDGGTVSATFMPATDVPNSITDQDSNTTNYSYNSAGNLTGITYDDGSAASYQYSPSGLLTSSTDARGQTSTYAYNAQGLLTQETFSDGTFQAYAYNAQGDLISAQATDGGVTTYGCNAAGELTSVTNPSDQVESYTYNSGGQELTRTEPDGSVTQYSYTPAGQLAELQDGSGNLITQYTYNAQGQLTGSLDGNGQTTSYTYDPDGNLTQILTQAADGTTTSQLNYTYDADGRPVTAASLDGTWTYSYDPSGQLTNAVFASTNPSIPNQNLTYEYDAAGNRTETIFNGAVNDYTTNGLNQYTASDGTTYDYDADGNLVSATQNGATTTYTYNSQNQLTAENGPNGNYTYQYDALGNMVSSTDDGVVSNYIIDPLAILASAIGPLSAIAQVYDAAGNVTATYDYGDGLAADISSSGTYYYNTDATGNVTSLSGAGGDLVDTYDYSPFGTLLASTGTVDNPFQYSGGLGVTTDPDGLVDMTARYYDPTTGRFISRDPINVDGGINLYEYTGNAPTFVIDPIGLTALDNWNKFVDYLSPVLKFLGYELPGPLPAIPPEAVPFLDADHAKDFYNYARIFGNNNYGNKIDKYSNPNGPGADINVIVPPPGPPIGAAYPDPHLVTFDGLYYSFQTAGEFVLVKDTNGGTFQVQGRLAAPVGASGYSVITEIGIQVGADVVTIDATRSAPVWVDGQAITFTGNTFGLADGLITKTATGYVVTLDTGESVAATINSTGPPQTGPSTAAYYGISVIVSLPPNATPDSVEGLLGNYNGNPNDDLTLADGTVEPTYMPTTTLYGVYADSWRVTQATSLLDYGPGQTTATFTDTNYPGTPISVFSFPAQAVAAATALVEQAGITDPNLQQAAIYDYLVTGNPSSIAVEANLQQEGVTTVAQTDFGTPPPPPEVGILASGTSEVEATSGPTTVAFQVYLTGDTSQAVTVDYTVVAPDATYLGASDFGGALPSGTVTLGPGLTSSDVSISLPNGIGTARSKTLEVQVSAAAPVSVIGATAQETIVNSAPVAGVAPVFGVELANDPSLLPTQNGTTWTFDLGALRQGEVFNPGTLSLAVLNLAGTGADDLAATVAASGDGGLPTSVSPSFAALAPGGMLDIADLAVATTSPGAHSETFTITSYDTNASGYMATLPTQTVTVTDTVITSVFNLAAATIAPASPIALGNARVNGVLSQALDITNSGVAPAEDLDATAGPTGGAARASGSINLLPAGQSDTTSIVVGLSTAAAGLQSGTATIDFASDGTGTDGSGQTALPAQHVTVTGAVYREAAAAIAPISEIVHVNDPGTAILTVSNTDPADGFSENLIASLTATTGGIGIETAGPTGEIAAGASDSTSLEVSWSTATAGAVSGAATVDLTSDGGTGPGSIDGLGQIVLPAQDVPVNITVDNYAAAGFAESGGGVFAPAGTNSAGGANYTLDLGALTEGSSAPTIDLSALNTAAGPADLLSGSFSETGLGAFANALSSFSDLAAEGSDPVGTVTLSTATAGAFNETITLAASGSNASGYDAAVPDATLTIEGTVAAPSGLAFNLTTGPDTFVEPPGSSDNTVIATTNTLSAGDDIDPGNGGGNTLVLQGTGVFNMTLPATLADIDTVTAQEGQASYVHNGVTYPSRTQIVDLRSGLDATIDVAPATINPNNPNAPTITIVGAANDTSIINLATGNDAVTLGSAQETVNGGGGNNTFYVNAATIAATIKGGSGINLLEVSGGGTMAMGANIRQIADALLIGSSTPYDFTANSLSGLLVDDLGTGTTDTMIAGASNQTLTGGGAGKLTMDAANQSGGLFKDAATIFNGDTVKDLVNGDMIDVTGLAFSAADTSLGFAFNSGPDTTTMSVLLSGTEKTAITLLGQYMAADFSVSADTAAPGTLITLNHELNLSAPH